MKIETLIDRQIEQVKAEVIRLISIGTPVEVSTSQPVENADGVTFQVTLKLTVTRPNPVFKMEKNYEH